MIKFTIITVCYNASTTIRETIDSVLGQTYQELEYIVVDSKSEDGTVEILQSITDKRLTFISEKDSGIYNAMNKGLKMASGDYLIFLGADDIFYDKDVLKKVAGKLTGSNDVVYGDVMLKTRQRLYNGAFSRWTWGHRNICHQSIFYPKSVYGRYMYNEKYRSVADWDYNLRLLIDSIKFTYIRETICTFNDNDGLSSSSKDYDFLKVRRKLVCKAVGFLPYCWGILQRAKRRLLNEKW
ncbi:MAG: glycosyltransferase [Bacteroidaceae bacterium]|nr:glycosyltransferase [Bacteroidaceae bacterium]